MGDLAGSSPVSGTKIHCKLMLAVNFFLSAATGLEGREVGEREKMRIIIFCINVFDVIRFLCYILFSDLSAGGFYVEGKNFPHNKKGCQSYRN